MTNCYNAGTYILQTFKKNFRQLIAPDVATITAAFITGKDEAFCSLYQTLMEIKSAHVGPEDSPQIFNFGYMTNQLLKGTYLKLYKSLIWILLNIKPFLVPLTNFGGLHGMLILDNEDLALVYLRFGSNPNLPPSVHTRILTTRHDGELKRLKACALEEMKAFMNPAWHNVLGSVVNIRDIKVYRTYRDLDRKFKVESIRNPLQMTFLSTEDIDEFVLIEIDLVKLQLAELADQSMR